MKGDFSRSTFDPARHYSGVRMQQGRVQLDADWNEQADLARHRVEVEALGTLGHCGAPLDAAAFGAVAFGGPADAQVQPGVAVDTAGDLILTPGRYYVDGILCQSERHVRYGWQPDLPGPWAETPVGLKLTQAGFHLLYLDVWERHLTALEHPRIRETALGGPDTATRTRTVWQVRSAFLRARANSADAGPLCGAGALPAAPTGTLRARAEPDPADQGPCVVPPGAGYRGLENQLYRVEVHAGGTALDLAAADTGVAVTSADPQTRTVVLASGGAGAYAAGDTVELYLTAAGRDVTAGTVAQVVSWSSGTGALVLTGTFPAVQASDLPRLRKIATSTLTVATWKWSRDNGIVVSRILSIDAATREIVVESLGVDDVLDIRPGHWVEVTDDYHELNGLPGQLLQVERIDATSRTVVVLTPPALLASVAGGVDASRTPRLRRWDGVGAVKANAAAGAYATLEDGVQVRFEPGTYGTGDYWLIPARTATADAQNGSVEWQVDAGGTPVARARMGIVHHYCRLAVVERTSTGAVTPVTDCRCLFVPLTSVPALHYVSGAGQEARPVPPWTAATRVPLGLPLVVGVANGSCHDGAMVRFRRIPGAGQGTVSATSTDGGLAQVDVPVGPGGLASCRWFVDCATQHQMVEARLLQGGVPVHPPIRFNASLSVADQVAYTPADACGMAGADPAVETVRDALDWLCARVGGGCHGLTVSPEPGWMDRVREYVAVHKDVDICFQAGTYPLEETLAFRGRRRVVLHGAGPATFFQANGLSRALYFERCDVVQVQWLSAQTGATAGDAPNGTLSFLDCRSVSVEDVHLRCPPGDRRDAACLVVMNVAGPGGPPSATSATIRGCRIRAGARQQGILLINPGRAVVEDNDVRGWGPPAPSLARLEREDSVRYLRAILHILLQESGLFTGPGRWWKRFHEGLVAPVPPLDMLGALERAVQGGATPSDVAALTRWIGRLGASASRGIAAGGTAVGDVRVRGNVVEGAVQGIHVGTSHAGEPVRRDLADRVTVSGNRVVTHLPFQASGDGHGIFVGNCWSAQIDENQLSSADLMRSLRGDATGAFGAEVGMPLNHVRAGLDEKLRTEGIRAYGVYGPMLLIRENHVEGFIDGVLVSVLNAAPNAEPLQRRLWRVSHNVAYGAFQVVNVISGASEVQLDGNVLAS